MGYSLSKAADVISDYVVSNGRMNWKICGCRDIFYGNTLENWRKASRKLTEDRRFFSRDSNQALPESITAKPSRASFLLKNASKFYKINLSEMGVTASP
jgi:hypothetical protein